MPEISPTLLLIASLAVTAMALGVALIELHRRRARLRRLARETGCEFQASADPALIRAILPHLPAPGAADVRLIDLVSCPSAGAMLVIGRVDYSLGAVRHRRDNTRIIAIRQDGRGEVSKVEYAPGDLPRLEQYRQLLTAARPH